MLPVAINLTVNTDSSVPVRDQLVEQLGWQIASGILKGNDKLPSIRALAQKLGIHHGTVNAAYNELAEIGMIEIRHGSGVRVVPDIGIGESSRKSDLHSLLMQFVAKAIQSGFSNDQIKNCCQQFIKRDAIKKIVIVDRNPDFHAVLLAELKPHFSIPVIAVTVEQLKADHSIFAHSLVVTSLYHFLSLQSLPLDPTRFVICNIETGQELITLLKALPASSIVVLVSVSPTLLKHGVNVIAGLRGESIAVRPILTDDTKELTYIMKHAKAIICDLPSRDRVRELAKKVPVSVFRLYSDATIQHIKEYLND